LETLKRRSRPTPAHVALALACLTAALYSVGAGRAFGYDAAVTMASFVDGPPMWAFTRQVVWNNHPLFSFAAGIVADVTGSTAEVTMRAAPIGFSALAVGLLTWRIGSHVSTLAGAAGGLSLMAHPLIWTLGSDVRGYSLALLAIVLAGIAVFDARSPWMFGVAAFLAVGTHLHAAIPVAALVAYLMASRRLTGQWRTALLAAALGTVLVYAGTLATSGRSGEARLFRPSYLRDALWELLGGNSLSVISVGAVVLVGLVASRPFTRPVLATAATAASGIVAIWLIAPLDLYPRFVYWAVPGVAVIVAVGVRRAPWTALLVFAAAAANAWMVLPNIAEDDLPNRALARAAGSESCMLGGVPEYMVWYSDDIDVGDHCGSVAIPPLFYPEVLARQARAGWPVLCWSLDGAQVRARSEEACP
jgi:hypothetical protein